ncbi:MAG: tRNA (N6-threonylcarbamoyladenosine(37)-N6)-methyltransferase TrmO [Anaerolineae bacterium]|nr:tRNA (N6-threonylcarbamoyladenosine(37)-N6)-methyltransferase TrmO [Anaerolineae bacterium]
METTQPILWLDPAMGMAGDMFSAALIGLGAPEEKMLAVLETAGGLLGEVRASIQSEQLPDGNWGRRLRIAGLEDREPLSIEEAPGYLESALEATGVRGAYAAFARQALEVLAEAERIAHSFMESAPAVSTATLPIIGRAHTPYHHEAPYQPQPTEVPADEFYIEIAPEYATGLTGLDSFTHIFIISYLDRSHGYRLYVSPPWRGPSQRLGVFATRSPDRPSPIGLTRARLRRIEGNRIYTGPLDLFDGTPILDIKPLIHSLDEADRDAEETGNDGWLEGSEHLELHRRGIPHSHPGGGHLHEAQDILLDVTGAAWGLQWLNVELDRVYCFAPVHVGGGTVSGSHGQLSIPAPATKVILQRHHIPYAVGPVEVELLTPTGAAILAALNPTFLPRDRSQPPSGDNTRVGIGLGRRRLDRPNALRVYLSTHVPLKVDRE